MPVSTILTSVATVLISVATILIPVATIFMSGLSSSGNLTLMNIHVNIHEYDDYPEFAIFNDIQNVAKYTKKYHSHEYSFHFEGGADQPRLLSQPSLFGNYVPKSHHEGAACIYLGSRAKNLLIQRRAREPLRHQRHRKKEPSLG